MVRRKILGLTMRVVKNSGYNEIRDAISHDWTRFLESMGYSFVFIPNGLLEIETFLSGFNFDGFILTGGDSLCPESYGSDAIGDETACIQRDMSEKVVLEYALREGKPVLGICRGMQFINGYFGGSLIKDISLKKSSGTHVLVTHEIAIFENKMLGTFGKKIIRVNSFHNDGIDFATISKEFNIWALSEKDQIIEGIQHCTHNIWGIMWHPERKNDAEHFDRQLFRLLFG